MSKSNVFIGPYADSLRKTSFGDQLEMSLEEQIERAEWEVATAQSNLFRLQKRLQDSGVSAIDNSPGRELDNYADKHG